MVNVVAIISFGFVFKCLKIWDAHWWIASWTTSFVLVDRVVVVCWDLETGFVACSFFFASYFLILKAWKDAKHPLYPPKISLQYFPTLFKLICFWLSQKSLKMKVKLPVIINYLNEWQRRWHKFIREVASSKFLGFKSAFSQKLELLILIISGFKRFFCKVQHCRC